MTDANRIHSFDALSTLKSKIETVERSDNDTSVDTRPTRNAPPRHQQNHPQGQQRREPMPANTQRFQAKPRQTRPPLDHVLETVQNRVNQSRARPTQTPSIPSLEDFIMRLQEHQFSFTFSKPNQLHKFVKAQEEENIIHQIAWTGGDLYMTAVMVYQTYAVTDMIDRALTRAVNAAMPKASTVSESSTAATQETVEGKTDDAQSPVEQDGQNEANVG